MDDRKLEELLSRLTAPEPEKDAQDKALMRAMAAFDEKMSQTAQEKPAAQRPTGISNILSQFGRKFMQKRFILSGTAGAVATCALVAVLGVSFFHQRVADITGLSGQQAASSRALENVALENTAMTAPDEAAAQARLSIRRESEAAVGAPERAEILRRAPEPVPPPSFHPDAASRLPYPHPSAEESAPPARLQAVPGGQGAADMAADAPVSSPVLGEALSLSPPGEGGAFPAQRKAMPMQDRAAVMPAAPATFAPVPADVRGIAPVPRPDDVIHHAYQEIGRDQFQSFEENSVKSVQAEPVSTFSIDVDTASYSFVRRALNSGVLPQKNAVRIEEMINYFDYDYPVPEGGGHPFMPTVAVYDSPWRSGNKIIHIGIKGYEVQEKPRSNLVFLIDTSGSMHGPDRLPLLVNSFRMLLDTLSPEDTVGIVTYAGQSGVVLEPTRVSEKHKILAVLEGLRARGGTAGGEGIRQAYQLAEQSFIEGGNNRIILATDGDFNVGIANRDELKGFVERKRRSGIYLSVLGFGRGNYNDRMMQALAQNGNGTAAYIDTLNEARKVLVDEASSMMFTIARDVKIQVEFNPQTVQEYRLVGYETRALNREDFNNDNVDAGDIGAGHSVTAIYEITPAGAVPMVDGLRYGRPAPAGAADHPVVAPARDAAAGEMGDEYAFLKIRYKKPDSDTSTLMTRPVTTADEKPFDALSDDIRFASAVASFAQMLKGSKFVPVDYDAVIETANQARGEDAFGYRTEFVSLVRLAKTAAGLQPHR